MKKIAIVIKNESLYFKYRIKKLDEPNLLNTNVISNDEVVFSDEYIKENENIVGLFISDLVKEKGSKNLVVSSNEIIELMINIICKLPKVECLTIDNDENMTYALCEKIIKSKNIKKVNCYSIPEFMIELFDKNGIIVESRYEVLFTSNFMADNNLTSYSKMYYKNSVNISAIMNEDDIEDINTFLSINKYLKTIHFDKYSFDYLEKVVEMLVKNGKKKVTIQIHEDLEDLDAIQKLKNYNKEIKKKNKIKIELAYSEDYLNKNYAQQITYTTLKICAVLILGIIMVILGYVTYNKYQSEAKDKAIHREIERILESDDTKDIESISEDSDNEPAPTELNGKKLINSYGKLLQINDQTVGWLTVKNTKINYPVVQAKNNSYYLNKNFYKETDYNGWVFMDYRNDSEDFDDNTIIYAHNRYASGVMFGTLENISKKSYYTNNNNLYITFNSLYKEYTWKIFSFYGIDVTSDYLITTFLDDEDEQKVNFFNMLKDRSEYDFGVTLDKDDKILTLSTCLDNNRRFVVHAVLVK